MGDPRLTRTLPPDREPASPRSVVLPWVLLVTWGVVASLLATWLFIEREDLSEELSAARLELVELRRLVADAEARIGELTDGLEEQQAEVERRGESVEACREALQRISAAWGDVALAMEAAGQLNAEEARSFAAEAERQRRAAVSAARRCR